MAPPLLELRGVVKHFRARGSMRSGGSRVVHAVCDVSITVDAGETFALVGESGCGKSTTAQLAVGLLPATSGTVTFDGDELAALSPRDLRRLRQRLQIVFQDPSGALNPRMTVGSSIAEPLVAHRLHRHDAREHVRELMALTELNPDDIDRFPHELSGGQRQRVGIARALACGPDLVVLDEPVSALDTSIQAGIINLLSELKQRMGVAYLVISHDLTLVRHIAQRVAVMYLGRVVETGARDEVFDAPLHPYTQALLSAVPVPEPDIERARQRIVLVGDPPSPIDPPSGCRFRTRCWKAQGVCAEADPELVDRGHGHPVACWFPEPLALA